MDLYVCMHVHHQRVQDIYIYIFLAETVLHAGRSRVRFPIESLEFFSDNSSDRTMYLA